MNTGETIMVTGGLGYIGSHIVLELLKNNYTVIIVDNLSNSHEDVLNKIEKISSNNDLIDNSLYFYNIDVSVQSPLFESIFMMHNISHVIHMAAHKSVSESIENPILYYKNNIDGLLCLLKYMKSYEIKNLIFSSSATVYGDSEPPFNETSLTGINLTNPYGKSKYMCEEILKDIKDMNIYLLRYFNPIGCHESGLIGDNPNGIPNNIMPYLLRVANREYDELSIFGNDYDTKDGTPERDYIHVCDLATAHVAALKNTKSGVNIYNVGTGKSTSVSELIGTFEKVNNIKINYKIADRREGDVPVSYCVSDQIYKELGWKATYTLEDMCKDSWNFIKKLNKDK
jgi:UDP-glucose 4-epimerase